MSVMTGTTRNQSPVKMGSKFGGTSGLGDIKNIGDIKNLSDLKSLGDLKSLLGGNNTLQSILSNHSGILKGDTKGLDNKALQKLNRGSNAS